MTVGVFHGKPTTTAATTISRHRSLKTIGTLSGPRMAGVSRQVAGASNAGLRAGVENDCAVILIAALSTSSVSAPEQQSSSENCSNLFFIRFSDLYYRPVLGTATKMRKSHPPFS
ncbi:MAG TPA: hypothetical protein VMS16_02415 [Mycobacterium sp.]|nr:hypothetical protein [Mycobacterium sp.]